MPRRPAPLPTELGDAFTRDQALAAGVTPRRIRARDLETPFRGVRLRPGREESSVRQGTEPLEHDRRVRRDVIRKARAYDLLMPGHAFFAGRTAAVIFGAPIGHGDELEVAVHAPARAPRRRGIRGVKVATRLASVREHEGLRVASPASTWAMLGAELSTRELVTLGDAFVRVARDDSGRLRAGSGLVTIEELKRAATAGPRRGAARLRDAAELVRVGSASPLETEYRLDAAAAGLPDAELDVEIFDARGKRIGITEVVYRPYRVVVEIEGDHHRTSRIQWNRDIEKHAAYVAEGWEVVRLTSVHVRGGRATSIVRDVLMRRGWRQS